MQALGFRRLLAFRLPPVLWALGGVSLVATVLLGWWLLESGAWETLTNRQLLLDWVVHLGFWGPLTIMALMGISNVMSPLPTTPIIMVAGAVYGPALGTAYVVSGATVGAVVACLLTRQLSSHAEQSWQAIRPYLHWLSKDRSQRRLMIMLLVSRLMPFVPFAMVSYAMGFTQLSYWRFAVATLVGALPVAYLISTSGELLFKADALSLTTVLVIVSAVVLVALLSKVTMRVLQDRLSALQ